VLVHAPGDGKLFLVGGNDYVQFKVRGADVGETFCQFEVATTPGFGPPLHTHEWGESFYVLEGEFEFDRLVDGDVETITAGAGATVSVPPGVAHGFRGKTEGSRMLITHAPAGLESFFEEFGIEVSRVGEVPAGLEPPDPARMAEVLPRHGVHIVGAPAAV
jgi:quercetin dioxygenase-like cupin family protein